MELLFNMLEHLNESACVNVENKNEKKRINVFFKYNSNLLINKNELINKKLICALNKMTLNNYYNIYFENIDIFTDKKNNGHQIIKLVYKKIIQNPSYIDAYINFILLNKNLTIAFINHIQNLFENDLKDNIIIIDIIHFLYSNNIIKQNLFDQMIHYLFLDTDKYINHLIQLYLCSQNIDLKNKILQIPNLSYRYKFKLN